MLKSADVAPYIRAHAPWLAEVAHYYIASLNDASAYPFIGHAVGDLIEKSSKITDKDRSDIASFFACIEFLLENGDSNVNDLVYMEVAEVLVEVNVLREFVGPRLCAIIEAVESKPQRS